MESPAVRAVHLRFGILCVLGYVALSWAVRFDMRRGAQIASLLYPLDTFSMYAPMPGELMSHLLIRDGQGAVHRVTAFRSFDCAEPVTGNAAQCADKHGIEYHYDDLTNYIQSHAGPGESDVELITRTWEVRRGAPPTQTSDCIIAHCKVSR
jgi:hypothetical protein